MTIFAGMTTADLPSASDLWDDLTADMLGLKFDHHQHRQPDKMSADARSSSSCSSFLAISRTSSAACEDDPKEKTAETVSIPQPVHAELEGLVEGMEVVAAIGHAPPTKDQDGKEDYPLKADWMGRINRAVAVVKVPLPVLLTSNILLFAIGFLIGRRIGSLPLLLQS